MPLPVENSVQNVGAAPKPQSFQYLFRLVFAYGRRTGIDDQDEAGRPDLLRLQSLVAT